MKGGGDAAGTRAARRAGKLTNCLRPRSRLVRNFLTRMVQAVSAPIVHCLTPDTSCCCDVRFSTRRAAKKKAHEPSRGHGLLSGGHGPEKKSIFFPTNEARRTAGPQQLSSGRRRARSERGPSSSARDGAGRAVSAEVVAERRRQTKARQPTARALRPRELPRWSGCSTTSSTRSGRRRAP